MTLLLYYNNIYVLLKITISNNMQIIYDELTNKYIATDHKGNWYPTSPTMIGAIQNALSVKFYWHNLATK